MAGARRMRWWRCAISSTTRRHCRPCPRSSSSGPMSVRPCRRRASPRSASTSSTWRKAWKCVGRRARLRWLKHPWSVLAFQIAGDEGLRALHPDGANEERETPPAEPLLADLLARPQAQGLATLILIDEVLMYAREKAAMAGGWPRGPADRLLPVSVPGGDQGRPLRSRRLAARFRSREDRHVRQGADRSRYSTSSTGRGKRASSRCRRQDVAEVLRRRFFTPGSIAESRLLPPARYRGGRQHRPGRRDRAQGPGERGTTLPRRLSLPPGSDRHLLHQVGAVGRVPAHARDPADLRHRGCATPRHGTGRRWSAPTCSCTRLAKEASAKAARELAGTATRRGAGERRQRVERGARRRARQGACNPG